MHLRSGGEWLKRLLKTGCGRLGSAAQWPIYCRYRTLNGLRGEGEPLAGSRHEERRPGGHRERECRYWLPMMVLRTLSSLSFRLIS